MDKKEVIEILKKNKPTSDPRRCGVELCEAVDMAIATLQEPERNNGQWIEIIKDERFGDEWDEIAIYKCSVCESEFVECMGTYNFCPNCGADMRGETDFIDTGDW